MSFPDYEDGLPGDAQMRDPYLLRRLNRAGRHAFSIFGEASGGWMEPVAYVTHCDTWEETKSHAAQIAAAPHTLWALEVAEETLRNLLPFLAGVQLDNAMLKLTWIQASIKNGRTGSFQGLPEEEE